MTQDLAPLLVENAIKGSALLALAGLVNLALRRRSAAQRHITWAVAIAGLLLMEPLSLWFPARTVRLPVAFSPAIAALSSPPAESVPTPGTIRGR
jgi:hypothetical protein